MSKFAKGVRYKNSNFWVMARPTIKCQDTIVWTMGPLPTHHLPTIALSLRLLIYSIVLNNFPQLLILDKNIESGNFFPQPNFNNKKSTRKDEYIKHHIKIVINI